MDPNSTKEELQAEKDKGYSILMVPMGYYEQFLDNIDIALTDIAGISTSSSSKYINGKRWAQCRNDNLKNPFTKEIITVGDAVDDFDQYFDYFDLSCIPPELKSRPLYIHLDMSTGAHGKGDKTGIAGVWIRGKKPHVDGVPDSKELYYQLAFSVSVKAPKGHSISFEKNRQFIYWLREKGFNIKAVTYDTFQSSDLGQLLTSHGFNCEVISVDRVKDKICQPYVVFQNTIYEQRLVTYPTELLSEEVTNLTRDANGKIDHPQGGSKDQSDACCGALFSASKHAEEYAFDYGEDLDITLNVSQNQNLSIAQQRNQVNIEFEREMQLIMDPLGLVRSQINQADVNNYNAQYGSQAADAVVLASDGIIIW